MPLHPRRSLHLFGSLATGGAETWFLRLLESRPADSPWSADICLLDPKPGPYVVRARKLGCRILSCPATPVATFFARLTALLRRERYDAVHSHVLLFGGAIAAAAAVAGAPVRTVHAHNSQDGQGDGLPRRVYRRTMRSAVRRFSNLTIACSAGAAELLGSDKTTILPYGLDLNSEPGPGGEGLRAELGLRPDDFVVGNVGRLHPQKNQKSLIDSFARAIEKNPRLRLLIVGEGDERSRLAARIQALELGDRVTLAGRRSDVPQLLGSVLDAFVMPSLYEGLPVALLEAQAAGLPCLVSDAISSETFVIKELIRTVPLDGDWAGALAALPDRQRWPAAEAREALRAGGFSIADSWHRLTALYDGTLARRARWAEAA